MAADPQVPAEPAVRSSRAGRDLPAAILVGLALAAAVVLTLVYWHWGFVLLVTAMLTLGTVELHDALKRIGMNSAVVPIVAGTVAVICGSYAAATQEGERSLMLVIERFPDADVAAPESDGLPVPPPAQPNSDAAGPDAREIRANPASTSP